MKVERHCLTMLQKFTIMKWLETHGTLDAQSVPELVRKMQKDITDFGFTANHVYPVFKEMGLKFIREITPGTETQILAQAIQKLYEELGVEPNPALIALTRKA